MTNFKFVAKEFGKRDKNIGGGFWEGWSVVTKLSVVTVSPGEEIMGVIG